MTTRTSAVSGNYWHGDEWRWTLEAGGRHTICVIEADEKRETPANATRVGYGFSRALDPPAAPEWLGNPS